MKLSLKLNWWENYVLSHLFGSNWETNLLEAFVTGATGAISAIDLTKPKVETYITSDVLKAVDSIAHASPMEAAMLAGVVETVLPSFVDAVYAQLEAGVAKSLPAISSGTFPDASATPLSSEPSDPNASAQVAI